MRTQGYEKRLCLDSALDYAMKSWPPVENDPNTDDICHLAEVINSICDLNIGHPSFSKYEYDEVIKRTGVLLLEEAMSVHLLIRCRPKEELLKEILCLGERIIEINDNFGTTKEAAVKSMFIYSAYLRIAKICREYDSRECHIPPNHRFRVYTSWEKKAESNPWLRVGIIMVRLSPPNQKMVVAWIPQNSMFYEDL